MAAVRRLVPLLDRVLVRKVAAPSQSVGGVLLPETASKINEGEVVAVGPGRRAADSGELIPVDVKEGDTVMLPEYGGQPVELGGEKYTIYRSEDILGVLTQ